MSRDREIERNNRMIAANAYHSGTETLFRKTISLFLCYNLGLCYNLVGKL